MSLHVKGCLSYFVNYSPNLRISTLGYYILQINKHFIKDIMAIRGNKKIVALMNICT